MEKNSSNSNQNSYSEVVKRSGSSNKAANAAKIAEEHRKDIMREIIDIDRFFKNSPYIVVSLVFILAGISEIALSYQMYVDLMSETVGSKSSMLALTIAFFIVALAAYDSHLIAKALNYSVYNLAVYNNEDKYSKNPVSRAAAEESASLARRRDLIKGIILGIFVVSVVTAISWHRVFLLNTISVGDYSLVSKLLPVICVIIEIFSGIYLNYLYVRFKLKRKADKLQNEFVRQKELCIYNTRMAHDLYQHAIEQREKIHYSIEVDKALYRYQHRSEDSADYVDPISAQKTLTVVVSDQNGLHIAGSLPNGEHCNSTYTDDKGVGILSWQSQAKEVLIIYVDSKQYKGPFMENSSIPINLRGMNAILSESV